MELTFLIVTTQKVKFVNQNRPKKENISNGKNKSVTVF